MDSRLEVVRREADVAKQKYRNDPKLSYKGEGVNEERYQRLKKAPDPEGKPGVLSRAWWAENFIPSAKLKGTDAVGPNGESRTAFFAAATDRRRLANAIHRNVQEERHGIISDVLATVKNPKHFDLFVRKVLADEAVEAHARNGVAEENAARVREAQALLDEVTKTGDKARIKQAKAVLAEAADAYREGPKPEQREIGESLEQAKRDQAAIDAILAKSPGLRSAYDRHLQVMHALRDKLVAMGAIHPNAREFYFPHFITDYAQDAAPKNLPRGRGLAKTKSAQTKSRIGGREWSRDYITAMSNYLDRSLEMLQRHAIVDDVAYKYHITRRPTAEILRGQGKGLSPLELYKANGTEPQGWVEYTLSSGHSSPRATSVAERLFGESMDNALPQVAKKFGVSEFDLSETLKNWMSETKVEKGKVNDIAPQAGQTVVIPKELADELTVMLKAENVKQPFMGITRWFKTAAIYSAPLRYNFRNAVGDFERALVQFGPDAMFQPKLWAEASREVAAAALQRKFSPDWIDAHRFGIMSSGRTALEANRMRDIGMFRKLTESPRSFTSAREVARWLTSHPSAMREDIFRFYLYKMNKARLQAGKEILMGAVDPEYIKGLMADHEPARAIAAIARKSMIDFGDFTPYEDRLRNGLVPFYSWMKGNLGFWFHDLPKAARRAVMNGAKGKMTQSDTHVLTGTATIAAAVLTARLWNNQNKEFADAAEKLPEPQQAKTSIIIPDYEIWQRTGQLVPVKTDDGRTLTMTLPDALDDALSAAGVSMFTPDLIAYARGNMPLEEVAARLKDHIGVDQINYAGRQLGPMVTLPMAAAGVRAFPNILEAQKVPPEKYAQNLFGAMAATSVPGSDMALDILDHANPRPTQSIPEQLGVKGIRQNRKPTYLTDMERSLEGQWNELNDLATRTNNIRGKLSDPNLSDEERAKIVAKNTQIIYLKKAEMQRYYERYRALRRTYETNNRMAVQNARP